MRTLSLASVVLLALCSAACKKQEPVAAAVPLPPADGPVLGDVLGVFSSVRVSADGGEAQALPGVSIQSVLNHVDLDMGTYTSFEACTSRVGLHFIGLDGSDHGVLKLCSDRPNTAMFQDAEGKTLGFQGIFNGEGLLQAIEGVSDSASR